MSATGGHETDPRLARLESLIGTLEREQRASSRDFAESDRERAEAARRGALGADWQAVQRRIDAGESTLMGVFAGQDDSPEAQRLVQQSQTNLAALRDHLPRDLEEELEAADEDFARLMSQPGRGAGPAAPDTHSGDDDV